MKNLLDLQFFRARMQMLQLFLAMEKATPQSLLARINSALLSLQEKRMPTQ
uniref:Uncharacterized protein n=1 Tax=Anguilla anguilla TaxID=7936 RepID=A0A0E9SH10_ANGAN